MPSKKKLRRKLFATKQELKWYKRDLKMYREICQDLEVENALLKKHAKDPKVKAWINGDEIEVGNKTNS